MGVNYYRDFKSVHIEGADMELNNDGSLPTNITTLVLETSDRYKEIYSDVRYASEFNSFINGWQDKKEKYIISKVVNAYNASSKYDLNYTVYPYLIETMFLVMSLFLKIMKSVGKDGNGLSSETDNYEDQLNVLLKNNNYEIMTDLNSLMTFLGSHFFTLTTDCKKVCEEKTKHSDSIIEKANEIYANRGVQDFATEYGKIRKNESTAKNFWLILSFSLLIGAGVIFYKYIFPLGMMAFSKDFSYSEHIFVFLIRFSYVALVLFVFIWVSKRYLVARNNEITYRHLTTMLNSFRSFYETADNDHKGLVVVEAAKVVFPAPTDKYADMKIDEARILDILKILAKR